MPQNQTEQNRLTPEASTVLSDYRKKRKLPNKSAGVMDMYWKALKWEKHVSSLKEKG